MKRREERGERSTTNLPASVVALVALEALLVLVGLLVLDEGVALMEHSLAVAALPALLDVGVLLAQVHT